MSKSSKTLIIISLTLIISGGFVIFNFSKAEETNNPMTTTSNSENSVYICPNATSLAEINPLCPGIVVLKLGETIDGMTLSTTNYDGEEYYIVYGFENGGGGEFGTIEESIKNLDDCIQTLTEDSFKNNSEQKKNALYSKLREVFLKIESQEYQEAINKLTNDIRAKADGYVDGDPQNDWIIDSTAQREICAMIDNLIYYLGSLY